MRDERLETTWPARLPMRVLGGDGAGDGDGHGGASVARLLGRMRRSAFQGRKLGEAFETWKWMIDSGTLIAMGLTGSLASAGLAPLVAWLVERGDVDVLVSTSANATEDLLEARGARVLQVDPEHVDDEALWRQGYYRFYDHVVSARDYDAMEDFLSGFFEHLAATWRAPAIAGVAVTRELGRRVPLAAVWARHGVPLFVPAAPDGPLAEGYRTAARPGPVVDFFEDYAQALAVVSRFMPPGPGTSTVFVGGGGPKDFIQITATSVCAIRGSAEACPHVAAIQLTTDNAGVGGVGGASVATESISWGKESPAGRNVMCFTDFTVALPLLCQGLSEHYGPRHVRPARASIAGGAARALAGPAAPR